MVIFPAVLPPRGARAFREAVAACFQTDAAHAIERLGHFSEADWRRHLPWLDASGMALYLLDLLTRRDRQAMLPAFILQRLQQNRKDNGERTAWLFAEMCEINARFRNVGLCFANLKGLTLCPDSVTDPALRCQMDLDFLVALEHAPLAAQVMNQLGYELHAISKGTWEFKAASSEIPSMKELYKPRPQRSVELHMVATAGTEHGESARSAQLQRSILRPVRGVPMFVLSPPDQFINQALHLLSHLRSEFTRMSWALEFIQHIRHQATNEVFWRNVSTLAEDIDEAEIAVGLSILLAEEIFGSVAPHAIRTRTFAALPPAILLWAHRYGRRAILSDFPGSKLYLLLERELSTSQPTTKAGRLKRLLPTSLPPMITHAAANETLQQHSRRYHLQLRYICFRIRFHLVKGIQFLFERSILNNAAKHQ